MNQRHRYRLQVHTVSPVAISEFHRRDQTVRTLNHLPGTSVRGALAAALLDTLNRQPGQDPFPLLFTSGRVRYNNFYPLPDPDVSSSFQTSWPLPATAASCKREPGFHHVDRAPLQGHGALDTLAAWLTGHAHEESYQDCVKCKGGLDTITGFYQQLASSPDKVYRPADPSLRLVARTAMDNTFGTADHGSLYTIEVIEEEQTFVGIIEVEADTSAQGESTLEGLLDRIGWEFWIGAARSRGLGHVRVDGLEPLDSPAPLGERIDAFNRALQTVGDGEVSDDEWFIPVTLLSDAILPDRYLRFQTALDIQALQDYAGAWDNPPALPPSLARHERFFCQTRRVSGWNMAHQLPRWDDVAVTRSSVFVFTVPTSERQTAETFFTRLEREGIGERRDEGFGELIVTHPFHSEVHPT